MLHKILILFLILVTIYFLQHNFETFSNKSINLNVNCNSNNNNNPNVIMPVYGNYYPYYPYYSYYNYWKMLYPWNWFY